jgi:malate dehydrogenase (quinone)
MRAQTQVDVVLVGAGIMSATLGTLLKQLKPGLTMEIFETLGSAAAESSNAWNNAGTGHAALCELNYTPQRPDGSVDVSKALEINEAFEVSKQFWSYLVESGVIGTPDRFIRQVPHLSFVRGQDDVDFLRKRFGELHKHHLFAEMQYSEDPQELATWMPLVMEGREKGELVAATRAMRGTDVNFGSLTRGLIEWLGRQDGVAVHLNHRVNGLNRGSDLRWHVYVQNKGDGAKRTINAKFVFLGAGGGALPLLQKSGIPEAKGFGGFPVSGQWLRCDKAELVDRHHAKVYGKAAVGSPPMSVPHLDTRVIDGKTSLLFGPYAGFSTKFLKYGSPLDLAESVKTDNILAMLAAGRDNIDLTRYLIGQVLQSPKDRLEVLKGFVPTAKRSDWRLEVAGQRVQIIKKDPVRGGILQFGTEVVTSADGSIAALLGASPGASTSVSIMLNLMQRCFEEAGTAAWQTKLKAMIPSFGESLAKDESLSNQVIPRTTRVLQLSGEGSVL